MREERARSRSHEEEETAYEQHLRRREELVTRGHSVADGWAGTANHHPHRMLYPTFISQIRTRNASKTLIFPLFD